MKKIFLWIGKIVDSKAFCMVTLVIAFLMSVLCVTMINIFTETVSYWGELYPTLFLIWGIFTSVGVFCNLKRLARKLNISNTLLDIAMIVGCFSVFISCISGGGVDYSFMSITHWTASFCFGVFCYLSALTIYIVATTKDKKNISLLSIVVAGALIDIIFCIKFGLMGISELFVLSVVQVCVFLSNYVVKHEKKSVLDLDLIESVEQENIVEIEK